MRPTFQLFSPLHLFVIATCLLAMLWLVVYLQKGRGVSNRRRDIMIFTIVFLLIELALVSSKIATGDWSARYNLPLHLCDISAITILIALHTRSKPAFEMGWYWGFVGGLMAILMPNLQFVDGYFIPFFVWHLFLIAGPVYQLMTDGFTLTYGSIYRVLGATVLLGCVMHALNRHLGSNYMFVNEKIGPFEAIGLPDFPYYLPYLLLMAGALYHLAWGAGVRLGRLR
jgi:hypothetical integral membrane protein (TIGR02206 family)